jgi:hypothetical protein
LGVGRERFLDPFGNLVWADAEGGDTREVREVRAPAAVANDALAINACRTSLYFFAIYQTVETFADDSAYELLHP